MKQTINFYDFERAFRDHDRQDQFTYEGKRALFDWCEQFDADCGTETELDVIALCCEFTEYENLAEFQDTYGKDDYPDYDSIADQTSVIQSDYYTNADDEWGDKPFIIADF